MAHPLALNLIKSPMISVYDPSMSFGPPKYRLFSDPFQLSPSNRKTIIRSKLAEREALYALSSAQFVYVLASREWCTTLSKGSDARSLCMKACTEGHLYLT